MSDLYWGGAGGTLTPIRYLLSIEQHTHEVLDRETIILSRIYS